MFVCSFRYPLKEKIQQTHIDNEWITGDASIWDITFGFNWIRILKKSRSISIFIDAREHTIQIGGKLWRKGCYYKLDKKEILVSVPNIRFRDLALVGLGINFNTITQKANWINTFNHAGGKIVSGGTYGDCIAAYNELKKQEDSYIQNTEI